MKRGFSLLVVFLTFASTTTSIGIPQKAEAAGCGLPTDLTLSPGDGKLITTQASGFAFGTYYLQVSKFGNLGIYGLSFQARPGFVQNRAEGFTGSSATFKTSLVVDDLAVSGQQSTITEKVINILGQTVCEGSFTVTVP